MRTDNRNVKNVVISIYFLLIVFAILLATVFRFLEVFSGANFYVFIGLFVILAIFHSVAGYFEYDSDGSHIIVINRGLLLTAYINYRETKLEFPRHKLVGYKIKNYFIYRSLVLVIEDKGGKFKKERFNITLLNRRKTKYVRQSLRKTLKENQKLKEA